MNFLLALTKSLTQNKGSDFCSLSGMTDHHGGEGMVTGDVSQSSRSVRLLAHIQVDQEAGEGGDAKVHLVFSFFSFYSC